jgi:hypothetical protein
LATAIDNATVVDLSGARDITVSGMLTRAWSGQLERGWIGHLEQDSWEAVLERDLHGLLAREMEAT